MTQLSNRRVAVFALLTGMTLVLASAGYSRWQRPEPARIKQLTERIGISEQLKPDQVADLARQGYATIIDLRPDGEAPDQPSSAQMHAAAAGRKIAFIYVPVPHGAIPDSAVTALDTALADNAGLVLLYCRSGKRAARTWGLVEASRSGGLEVEAILAAVKASGQSADDLRAQLAARVEARQPAHKEVQ
jgi:uncharacterized protein (TIGR01244 family)